LFIVLCAYALGRAADSTESQHGHACSRAIRSTTSIAAQAGAEPESPIPAIVPAFELDGRSGQRPGPLPLISINPSP